MATVSQINKRIDDLIERIKSVRHIIKIAKAAATDGEREALLSEAAATAKYIDKDISVLRSLTVSGLSGPKR
jgi:hypothetical protein